MAAKKFFHTSSRKKHESKEELSEKSWSVRGWFSKKLHSIHNSLYSANRYWNDMFKEYGSQQDSGAETDVEVSGSEKNVGGIYPVVTAVTSMSPYYAEEEKKSEKSNSSTLFPGNNTNNNLDKNSSVPQSITDREFDELFLKLGVDLSNPARTTTAVQPVTGQRLSMSVLDALMAELDKPLSSATPLSSDNKNNKGKATDTRFQNVNEADRVETQKRRHNHKALPEIPQANKRLSTINEATYAAVMEAHEPSDGKKWTASEATRRSTAHVNQVG